MLVQFGNNWIQKIPLTAKLDSACGLVQFWLSSEFFSSNYFQIGQHVVLLHILIRPRTILPCFQQVNLTRARDPIEKPTLGQRSTSQKHVTSMSCKLEPAIWSRDTGQRISCFDRCQLIMAGMSNIKEVHGKQRLYVSVNLFFWSMAAMLRDSVVAHEQYR